MEKMPKVVRTELTYRKAEILELLGAIRRNIINIDTPENADRVKQTLHNVLIEIGKMEGG